MCKNSGLFSTRRTAFDSELVFAVMLHAGIKSQLHQGEASVFMFLGVKEHAMYLCLKWTLGLPTGLAAAQITFRWLAMTQQVLLSRSQTIVNTHSFVCEISAEMY